MGKKHGGMANCGKVRAMTPKVDPSEDKRKRYAGRPGMRIKYNRFIVRENAQKRRRKRIGPNPQTV